MFFLFAGFGFQECAIVENPRAVRFEVRAIGDEFRTHKDALGAIITAEVGKITSATHSPRMKKNIGYANVPVELSALGTKLTVQVPDVGSREATVVKKPFFDPKKDIPKS